MSIGVLFLVLKIIYVSLGEIVLIPSITYVPAGGVRQKTCLGNHMSHPLYSVSDMVAVFESCA